MVKPVCSDAFRQIYPVCSDAFRQFMPVIKIYAKVTDRINASLQAFFHRKNALLQTDI
jgi:hypothetical protein